MATSKKKEKLSFEASMLELEKLLEQIEDPALPLDELVQKYSLAREHLANCRKQLDEFELKVKQLEPDGKITDFPLED